MIPRVSMIPQPGHPTGNRVNLLPECRIFTMSWFEALILGIVEGITEFLPVSSTGHLTITEYLLGFKIDDPGMVAFTAVIQIGAILAAVIYFWSDIWNIITAWVKGLQRAESREDNYYRFGWAIIFGSIPIAVVGLLFKDEIETVLRSMWFVAGGLVLWSVVLFLADRVSVRKSVTASTDTVGTSRGEDLDAGSSLSYVGGDVARVEAGAGHRGKGSLDSRGARGDADTTIWQALIIGVVQCFSLIPGVSRSGATISAGLFLGFDRVLATRLSFFLGIPALAAAGTLQAVTEFSNISDTVGWGPTLVGTAVSFVVGYASIAWLLKFVSKHSFTGFIVYRIILGGVIALLLGAGLIPAV